MKKVIVLALVMLLVTTSACYAVSLPESHDTVIVSELGYTMEDYVATPEAMALFTIGALGEVLEVDEVKAQEIANAIVTDKSFVGTYLNDDCIALFYLIDGKINQITFHLNEYRDCWSWWFTGIPMPYIDGFISTYFDGLCDVWGENDMDAIMQVLDGLDDLKEAINSYSNLIQ